MNRPVDRRRCRGGTRTRRALDLVGIPARGPPFTPRQWSTAHNPQRSAHGLSKTSTNGQSKTSTRRGKGSAGAPRPRGGLREVIQGALPHRARRRGHPCARRLRAPRAHRLPRAARAERGTWCARQADGGAGGGDELRHLLAEVLVALHRLLHPHRRQQQQVLRGQKATSSDACANSKMMAWLRA